MKVNRHIRVLATLALASACVNAEELAVDAPVSLDSSISMSAAQTSRIPLANQYYDDEEEYDGDNDGRKDEAPEDDDGDSQYAPPPKSKPSSFVHAAAGEEDDMLPVMPTRPTSSYGAPPQTSVQYRDDDDDAESYLPKPSQLPDWSDPQEAGSEDTISTTPTYLDDLPAPAVPSAPPKNTPSHEATLPSVPNDDTLEMLRKWQEFHKSQGNNYDRDNAEPMKNEKPSDAAESREDNKKREAVAPTPAPTPASTPASASSTVPTVEKPQVTVDTKAKDVDAKEKDGLFIAPVSEKTDIVEKNNVPETPTTSIPKPLPEQPVQAVATDVKVADITASEDRIRALRDAIESDMRDINALRAIGVGQDDEEGADVGHLDEALQAEVSSLLGGDVKAVLQDDASGIGAPLDTKPITPVLDKTATASADVTVPAYGVTKDKDGKDVKKSAGDAEKSAPSPVNTAQSTANKVDVSPKTDKADNVPIVDVKANHDAPRSPLEAATNIDMEKILNAVNDNSADTDQDFEPNAPGEYEDDYEDDDDGYDRRDAKRGKNAPIPNSTSANAKAAKDGKTSVSVDTAKSQPTAEVKQDAAPLQGKSEKKTSTIAKPVDKPRAVDEKSLDLDDEEEDNEDALYSTEFGRTKKGSKWVRVAPAKPYDEVKPSEVNSSAAAATASVDARDKSIKVVDDKTPTVDSAAVSGLATTPAAEKSSASAALPAEAPAAPVKIAGMTDITTEDKDASASPLPISEAALPAPGAISVTASAVDAAVDPDLDVNIEAITGIKLPSSDSAAGRLGGDPSTYSPIGRLGGDSST